MLERLLWHLDAQPGLFCLVTTRLTRLQPPEQFHVHLALENPPEEVQLRRWRERLGTEGAGRDELRQLVQRLPLHVYEIDECVRRAKILRAIGGHSGKPTLDEVREVLERRRGKSATRVLFGGHEDSGPGLRLALQSGP